MPDGISRSLARSRWFRCRLLEADHLVVDQESQSTAARNAKVFVRAEIAAADRFGVGHGPIHHFPEVLLARSAIGIFRKITVPRGMSPHCRIVLIFAMNGGAD